MAADDRKGIDPELVKFASAGLMLAIGNLAERLSSMDRNDEKRSEQEAKLKELISKMFDTVPKSASILLPKRKFAQYIGERRSDEFSELGVVSDLSERVGSQWWVLKNKKGFGKISPHEAHKINLRDYVQFKDDKNIKLARILDPIQKTTPYVNITDWFSGSPKKQESFVQIQEYVSGFDMHDVFGFLASLPASKTRKDAVERLLDKCFKDVFYWHENAPTLPGERPDVKKMREYFLKLVYQSLDHAGSYTNVALNKKAIANLQEKEEILYPLFPKKDSDYTRMLDSTLSNIILRTDVEELSKDNLDEIIKAIESSSLVHIDSRERYGHIVEDIRNIASSNHLSGLYVGEEQLFKPGNEKKFHEHLEKNYKCEIDPVTYAWLGAIRELRLRDLKLYKYAKRAFETRETRPNFQDEIKTYEAGIRHHDRNAVAHLERLVDLRVAEGEKDVQSLIALKDLVGDMSAFTKFEFSGDRK